MIDDKQTVWLLKQCVDGINPALLVSILGEFPAALTLPAGEEKRRAIIRAGRYCLAGCIAIALPVVLAELGKKHEIWDGHPGFPSGHMTFVTAASAALIAYRGTPWLLICAPCMGLMAVGLVRLGHHQPPEVFGGFVLGATLGTIITRVLSPSVRPSVAKPLDMPVEE